ncbi:hypothetical protein SLEP1_g21353 [Rubroshorea leprosula]|uniref:Uncharacterized protein n=1 Tax=Rubroshorea leprosula TaxID=152421 RepID=A0AAV5JD40_9ROSI|nr:hypothetical protein SLEP1_g21353 [Rubroshorea leprosula]
MENFHPNAERSRLTSLECEEFNSCREFPNQQLLKKKASKVSTRAGMNRNSPENLTKFGNWEEKILATS